MKSELIVEILRWVVDNHILCDIIGQDHFFPVCNKMPAAGPGKRKNMKNSRKMCGRNFFSKYYK